uniref:C-type lectin domain-containing protein n=2 Tax=Ornithorhynchus anatinus TaxID=9258 RepID=A0A6I8PNW5_ORNAN
MQDEEGYTTLKLRSKQGKPSPPPPDSHQYPHWHEVTLKLECAVNILLLLAVLTLCSLVLKQMNSLECLQFGAGNAAESSSCPGTSPDGNDPSTVVPTLRTCPEDWQLHQGKCYWFSNGSRIRTWNDSDADCEGRKSNLTVIRDMCELGFIWSKIPQSCKYWIRLPIQNAEGNWTWSNDSVLNWSLFKDNNPTNEKNEGQENKQCEMDPHRDQQNKKLKENKRAQENPKNERKKKQANKYHEKHKPSDKKNQCPVLSWGKIGLDSCDNANFWLCQQ